MDEAAPRAAIVSGDSAALHSVVATCCNYATQFLQQAEARQALKLRCAERLRLEHGVSSASADYAEQAVLANLEWGVDGLESALSSINEDARAARLEHCQKLLQVPVRLDPRAVTAGVPNCFLSSWASLYMALVFNLRGDDRSTAAHLLNMFAVDPSHARHDFAPPLWSQLFQPHTSNIQAWYNRERKKLSRAKQLSPSEEYGRSHSKRWGLPAPESNREQLARMEILDKLYDDALDENTRHYARYYLEWLDNDDRLDSPEMRSGDAAKPPDSPQSWSTSDSQYMAESAQPPGQWRVLNNSMFNASMSFTDEDRDNSYQNGFARDVSSKETSFKEADADDSTSQESENLQRTRQHIRRIRESNSSQNMADGSRGFLHDSFATEQVMPSTQDEAKVFRGRSSKTFARASAAPGSEAFLSTGIFSTEFSDSSEQGARRRHSRGVRQEEGRKLPSGMEALSAGFSKLSTEVVELKSGSQQQRTSLALKPPTHFVCPITHELFENPVTLETGQTYERSAIQDWLDKGNKSCPLTQQALTTLSLPKNNSVLQALVDAWKEQHPAYTREKSKGDAFAETVATADETSVIDSNIQDKAVVESGQWPEVQEDSDAKAESNHGGLDAVLACLDTALSHLLCTGDIALWEEDVLRIAELWVDWKDDAKVEDALLNSILVQRLMELLFTSRAESPLRATVCLLCDLLEKDHSVEKAFRERDPELKTVLQVLTLGVVPQSAVLLFLLKESPLQQEFFEVIPSLVNIMVDETTSWKGAFDICWSPRAAATFLLEEMVTMSDSTANMVAASQLLSLGAVPALLGILDSHVMEEKISAASILLSCIEADGGCRNVVALGCRVSSIVDLIHCNKGKAMTVGISLLVELIRLSRRSLVTRILSDVQTVGHLSTMHVLLVQIQLLPLEDRVQAAGLLLQLDLLAEPRMSSMFREEALEALLEALSCKENEEAQVEALRVLLSLSGRFSSSGRSLTEEMVLKEAGYEENHSGELMHEEDTIVLPDGEAKIVQLWEKRMATVLLQNGKALFEALSMALSSCAPDVIALGLIFAAWLSCALRTLPDIGMVAVAAERLLPYMINILNSDCATDERVLAAYCLESYVKQSDAKEQVARFSKQLVGPLRQLRQLTWCAKALLRILVDSSALLTHADMWAHAEVGLFESSRNGEVRALAHGWGHLLSGHSDGSMKMWDVIKDVLLPAHEVKEHTKAVSCFAVSEPSDKLISGSADKTVRIWLVVQGAALKCVQIIDLKDSVQAVAYCEKWICIVPQALGIKLLDENSPVKMLNNNKNVQSILAVGNKLYTGCTDSSLQVVDPDAGQVVAMQTGTRTLLGKKPIYAIQVYNEFVYTAGMPVDGLPAKVWNREDHSLSATFGSNADVRSMCVNEDFIYLGYSSSIEIWLRQQLVRVATLAVASRITALSLAGDFLYSGSEDGNIRVWALV